MQWLPYGLSGISKMNEEEYSWWIKFHDIPFFCEYPDCSNPQTQMTHNFDKFKDTHHRRCGASYDYIYLCGYHMNKYITRFWARVDAFTKDSLTPEALKEVKKRFTNPVTAWEDYVNEL